MIEMAKYVQQGIEVGCNLQRLCPMTLCVTRWPVSPGSSTDTLSQGTQPQCATLKSHSTRPLFGTDANSFSHFSQHTHCIKQVRKNCSPAKKSNMDIVFSHHEAITRCLPLRPSCNVLEVPVEGSARYCTPLRWDWEGGWRWERPATPDNTGSTTWWRPIHTTHPICHLHPPSSQILTTTIENQRK